MVQAMAGVCIVFLALPLVGLLLRAPWSHVPRALVAPTTIEALRLSLVVSLAATALGLLFGFPLAWWLARSAAPRWTALRALVVLPMVLPPVVGGVGLLAALGRRGFLGGLLGRVGISLPFTTAGAVLAATFVSLPLLVLAVEAGFRSLDPRYEDAAAAMGASRGFTLRHVTLPLLRPQIAAGLALAWARALGEFGATITFAGNLPGRTQTLPLAVYELLQSDTEAAIMVSLLLVAVSVVILVFLRHRFLPGL